MQDKVITIDNQPVTAGFFNEGRWLTDWITPDALEVQQLHKELTKGLITTRERLTVLWKWVASQIKYVRFVKGKAWIDGKISVQNDLWQDPNEVIRTRVGNCSNKSFLLASLLRNELPAEQVYCVLGNLYTEKPGGHAWVHVSLEGHDYIMESTTDKVPPLVRQETASRYEAVHYFNDEQVLAVPGRTQMIPYAVAYSDWLSDYLNWAYIQNTRRE